VKDRSAREIIQRAQMSVLDTVADTLEELAIRPTIEQAGLRCAARIIRESMAVVGSGLKPEPEPSREHIAGILDETEYTIAGGFDLRPLLECRECQKTSRECECTEPTYPDWRPC